MIFFFFFMDQVEYADVLKDVKCFGQAFCLKNTFSGHLHKCIKYDKENQT